MNEGGRGVEGKVHLVVDRRVAFELGDVLGVEWVDFDVDDANTEALKGLGGLRANLVGEKAERADAAITELEQVIDDLDSLIGNDFDGPLTTAAE